MNTLSTLCISSFVLVAVVLSTLLLSNTNTLVEAWTCTPSSTCDGAGTPPATAIPATRRCGNDYWRGNKVANIKDQFNNCLDDGSQCCGDPCTLRSTRTKCLELTESTTSTSPLCIFMPYSSTKYACIAKYKLCILNEAADCAKLPLCQMDNVTNQCDIRKKFSASEINAASLEACPALHGIVVAFLVLMFLSLVGAIIFVVVVVVYKQKKADEEEKKAQEEAEAAEAAAKQQQEEADF